MSAMNLSDLPLPPPPARSLDLLAHATDVLANGPDERALYETIEAALAELAGFRLLTILRATPAGDGLERRHSSNPSAYPAQGVKAVAGDAWLAHLLVSTTPQLSPDADAVRRRFVDADAIFGLGCESVLNLPVRFRGRNLGTLNLLHRAHWYGPHHGALCLPFVHLLGAAWAARTL
jgi:GAF domain-containing protein